LDAELGNLFLAFSDEIVNYFLVWRAWNGFYPE